MKQNNKKKARRQAEEKGTYGTYRTQAISQANEHQEKTNVAIPNVENVTVAREWIEENQK